MKPVRIIFLCLFLLYGGMVLSSVDPPDTALIELKTKLFSSPSNEQAGIFNRLSKISLSIDSEVSYAYADTAFQLASKFEDTLSLVFALKNMAEALHLLNRNEEAIADYEQAYNIASEKGMDTLVARIIYNEGMIYYQMLAYDNAREKFLEADSLFDTLGQKFDMANTRYYLGNLFYDQGSYPESLKWYRQSLNIANEENADKLRADMYNNIGIVYQNLGSYENALKNYMEVLHIAQKIDNKEQISYAYNNIGIVYYDWGKKEKALEYYQMSRQIDEQLNNRYQLAGYYINAGIIYDDWGQSDLAIGYYKQALEIYTSYNDLEGISNAKNNIGESLAAIGQFDEAISYINEAIEIEKNLGSLYGIATCKNTLAGIYFKKGKLNKALNINNESVHLADSLGLVQVQMDANELNYKIFQNKGNFKKALEYYKKFQLNKDSIYNDKFHQQITNLQIEKELENQEQEQMQVQNKLLKKEHAVSTQKKYLVIIFALMLVFGGLVFHDFRNKNRANRKLTEINSRLLENQKEHSKTLEYLTKSESKFRYLVENSPQGILYLTPKGKVLEANKKFLDTMQIDNPEELKTINALDYQVLKDAGISDDIHHCIEAKETVYNEGFFENKTGANIFLKFLVSPVMNDQKEVESLIVHIEDMTPVLLANKKSKELEQMYRILVENSLQAMLIVQEMKIIFANPKIEKLSQYTFDELQKKGRRWIHLLIHPDDFQRAANNIHRAFDKKEEKARHKYQIIRKDGPIRWMETLTSIVDLKGKPAMLIVAIDITERIEAENKLLDSENRLLELNSMKDKFFSIIAHDLKNPMGSILGFSNLLNEAYENLTEKQRKDYIKNLCVSSENAFKLLQNLLEWSRTQTGNIDYHPQKVMLDELINEVVKLMAPVFESKHIELIHSIPKNVMVWADANMIRVVIRNLLSNALKFTHPNGRVEIKIVPGSEMVEIQIIDNGVGISKNNQRLLFRIDNHLKTVGTNKEQGTGLGLLLCKEMVEINRGSIRLESQLGKGSSFIFDIPVNQPA